MGVCAAVVKLKAGAIAAETAVQHMRRATDRIRHITSLGSIALTGAIAACCALAGPAAAAAPAPLPSSDYTVHAVCPAPAPAHGSCMSLELVPHTATARAHSHPLVVTPAVRRLAEEPTPANGAYGFTPQALHTAYLLPTSVGSQTIALVDAYNDPTAAEDLKRFDEEFEINECGGCFKKINENGAVGNLPFPQSTKELTEYSTGSEAEAEEAEEAAGWGVEMSLDVQTARAICQTCKIVLVEAKSTHYPDLEAAEQAAISAGATEISNSWGGPEYPGIEEGSPFNHPGIVITASAGDDGFLNWASSNTEEHGHANFPASSPHVVAVGGTHLEVSSETGAWKAETVWNGRGAGGGGCSEVFSAPSWQQSLTNWKAVGCGTGRSVSDVSADADPYTGVAVYDTDGYGCETEENPHPGWCTIGGTSLASPLIAATFALGGGAHGVPYPAKTLYEGEIKHPEALHDVTVGSNGKCALGYNEFGISKCTPAEAAKQCSEKASCLAGVGYDGPSGVGTPDGIKAFEASASESKKEEAGGEGEEEPIPIVKEVSREKVIPIVNNPPPLAPPPPASSAPPVQLSGLGLTVQAIVALNKRRPKLSHIGFAFTSTVPIKVTITLTEHVLVHRRKTWKTIGHPLSGNAILGRNSWHLAGGSTLHRGAYRLTLEAPGVPAKTITFLIG